jgi:hypothetical protein
VLQTKSKSAIISPLRYRERVDILPVIACILLPLVW